MLEPLRARESLVRIHEFAYAFGSMDKADARNFYSELQRRAAGPGAEEVKPLRPRSIDQMQRMMGGMTKVEFE